MIDGGLTLGAMMAIQSIIGLLTSPVDRLVTFSQQAQDTQLSLERLNEVYELPDEGSGGRSTTEEISGDHMITFRNVSFAYPGVGNEAVLSHIDLEFPAGKTTGHCR